MVIKMVEATIEERGRVLIPKKIREQLNLRGGQEVRIETRGDEIIIKKKKSPEEFKQLKGCVNDSEIEPLDVKNMWAE